MFPSLTDNDAYMQKYDFFGDVTFLIVLYWKWKIISRRYVQKCWIL